MGKCIFKFTFFVKRFAITKKKRNFATDLCWKGSEKRPQRGVSACQFNPKNN